MVSFKGRYKVGVVWNGRRFCKNIVFITEHESGFPTETLRRQLVLKKDLYLEYLYADHHGVPVPYEFIDKNHVRTNQELTRDGCSVDADWD